MVMMMVAEYSSLRTWNRRDRPEARCSSNWVRPRDRHWSPVQPRSPLEQPRQDDDRRKNDKHSYNANSVLQLVGNGSLTDAQKQALTSEERQELVAR
jgi:hypothetical protein